MTETEVVTEIVEIFAELTPESQQTLLIVYSSGAHSRKFGEKIYQEGYCKR